MYEQFLPLFSIFIYFMVLIKALVLTRKVKGNGLGFEEVIIAGITLASILNIGIGVHDLHNNIQYTCSQEILHELVFGRNLILSVVCYSAMHYIEKLYPHRLINKNGG